MVYFVCLQSELAGCVQMLGICSNLAALLSDCFPMVVASLAFDDLVLLLLSFPAPINFSKAYEDTAKAEEASEELRLSICVMK